VRGRDASDLDGIPMDRIYLMQLSDLDHGVDLQPVIDTARQHRLLPGQGRFPINSILHRVREEDYIGRGGLEVFNGDLKAQDLHVVAREAMSALRRVWPR
jgi:4-hydroxyphenylpyruvate dioxygenase